MKAYHRIHRWICSLFVVLLSLSPLHGGERSFLAVSDIHFNVFHDLDAEEFRKLAGLAVEDWPAFFEGRDQPLVKLGEDSNYALMSSALAAAAKRFPDPPFVIFPGDFMGHEWQTKYNALALQTIEENPEAFRMFTAKCLRLIANAFRKHFPETVIFPTLGNDDSFCGDYWIQPGGEFLAVFANLWEPLLEGVVDPARFHESFAELGCYVADLPTFPNHQLIALNTVLWSKSYCDAYNDPVKGNVDCCDCINPGAAPGEAQFAWFEKKLAAARGAGKKVWLLMHVPPGLDSYTEAITDGRNAAAHFWTTDFTTRYLSLLGEYRNTVQLSFAGHTHRDDYRIDTIEDVPVLLHKILPAISPIYGNNPAIQIFEVDSKTGALTNWQTHFLSLRLPGDKAPPREWRDEYDAQEAFGLERFNAQTVSELFETIREDPGGEKAKHYRLFWQVRASVIPEASLPVYVCAVLNATFADYHRCVTGHGLAAPVRMESPADLQRLAGELVSAEGE